MPFAKPPAAARELMLVGAGRMGSALLDGWRDTVRVRWS